MSEHPYLRRCGECHQVWLPALDPLPCGHPGGIDEPLDTAGVVHSWTRVGDDTAATPARIIVMADFLGGALRVVAPLAGATTISIGDQVTTAIGEDSLYVMNPL